jgi:bifunctional non-homologous end joining protein LigD
MGKLLFMAPMLAKLVRELPKGEGWIYEAKFDGYRILALKSGSSVKLLSRRGSDFTAQFNAVAADAGELAADSALLDGEVVAVNAKGQPSFQILQNRRALPSGYVLAYYAFDLLHLNGVDLRKKPLRERKQMLRQLVAGTSVRLSADLPGTPAEIIKAVRKHGLEGVVAKKVDSIYESGQRSGAWLKLPLKPKDEFIIGAYRPAGAALELLLVGYQKAGKLWFCGKVRQGLNRWNRKSLVETLQPLQVKKCPFANLPSSEKKSHWGEGVAAEEMENYAWVQPKLVADVRFTEWTETGVLRHAEFVGLREDLMTSGRSLRHTAFNSRAEKRRSKRHKTRRSR